MEETLKEGATLHVHGDLANSVVVGNIMTSNDLINKMPIRILHQDKEAEDLKQTIIGYHHQKIPTNATKERNTEKNLLRENVNKHKYAYNMKEEE